MSVTKNGVRLKTILGSCVGVVLWDSVHLIGGLAHIMLPRATGRDSAVGKYADTAIPELVRRIEETGGSVELLRAILAGGANMFPGAVLPIGSIGTQNVESARHVLGALAIPICFEHVGGTLGRVIVFNNGNGDVEVVSLRSAEREGGAK